MLKTVSFFTLVLLVHASAAAQDNARSDVQVRAQFRPELQTLLSSELSATVIKVIYSAGDRFNKGDVLVKFDCGVLKIERDKSVAKKMAADARLRSVKRLNQLSSASELELKLVGAEQLEAAANLKIVDISLTKCDVRAPFNGHIMEIQVTDYEFVKGGSPLLNIYKAGPLEIDFLMPSHALSWIKAGTPFWVTIDELGREIAANITSIGSYVDPVSQTIRVQGAMTGDQTGLLPGMSGETRFNNMAE